MKEQVLRQFARKHYPEHYRELKRLDRRIHHRPVKSSIFLGVFSGILCVVFLEFFRGGMLSLFAWVSHQAPQLQKVLNLSLLDTMMWVVKIVSLLLTMGMFLIGYWKGFMEQRRCVLKKESLLMLLALLDRPQDPGAKSSIKSKVLDF